ncbi:uncharacterized protein LOC109142631 [Larimichthys crocea]|uniref:uncharacterized protein LOC109142631 n=1 Tax=Larimichthys crocea TaxID=215358 RepID=UPI000F5E8D63|nr:uncharacterized protein LOC109142631 [Larimichthys crocea]
MSLDPKESLIRQTEDGSTRSRSKEEDGTGPGPQDGLSPESGPGLDGQKSEDDLTREKKTLSSNGPGGQRSLDVTGEKKKKKQTLSLREAQAVLLRKTQGGEGDKMAALLMKHVEKEKKKLLTVTSTSTSSSSATPSSSVKSSVRTFHTQKGQYTVHFNEPTGQ